jgi:hypothetical protein
VRGPGCSEFSDLLFVDGLSGVDVGFHEVAEALEVVLGFG